MNEILLGFHLRVAIEHLEKWNSKRRTMYLLRQDIDFPLSVDHVVWPSENNPKLFLKIFSDYYTGQYEAPNGLNLYSVKNKANLRSFSYKGNSVLIGITVVNSPLNTANKLIKEHCIDNIIYKIENLKELGWKCLGYDVGDKWLLSGLMNCGSDLPVMTSLAKRFAHSLNEFGLFNSIKVAHEFRIDCNLRVPEHAPFYVYGIWAKLD